MARIVHDDSQVSFARNRWRSAILWVVLSMLFTAGTLLADRDQTCKLKAGNQQADYHCPEHFDAVVAGEGTDRCDGSCYASKNTTSLSSALRDIIARRFHFETSTESLMPLAQRLQEQGFVRIRKGEALPGGHAAPEDLVLRVRQQAK